MRFNFVSSFFFYQQQTTNPEILQPKQNRLQTPNFPLNHSSTWVKGLVPGSVWKFFSSLWDDNKSVNYLQSLSLIIVGALSRVSLLYWRDDVSAVRAQTHCGQDWWMKPPSVFRCSFSFQQHERKLSIKEKLKFSAATSEAWGTCVPTQKTDRWTKLCHTSTWSVQEDTSTASLLPPSRVEN